MDAMALQGILMLSQVKGVHDT